MKTSSKEPDAYVKQDEAVLEDVIVKVESPILNEDVNLRNLNQIDEAKETLQNDQTKEKDNEDEKKVPLVEDDVVDEAKKEVIEDKKVDVPTAPIKSTLKKPLVIDTDLPILTTEDTEHINSNRMDDDDFDMDGEDSFDLTDEEENGTNDI